ncbi:sigma-70 family RNA polymerase sigma factor [sulfur-oxidizing endosymbiont of Gigantopelta aegis]|uniref:sigma-70 family RNA polymerase sigma factor n=1 Tax=sulfur-oxidizing endosymbiont of Gigantopelta aegis TaxID=2794934 RepID=UPI0018DCF77F|nr:sigma-70 family RNA polymerase sigma factor [sulfur-oxidizing endosymbiont of Gigantopelta aegis]
MTDEQTDEQLIHAYQQGNVAAFEILYLRYKNAIYHYLFRQTQSTSSADELHQDVWLNLIKSRSRFKQDASFKTWLYTIARNRLLDHYRQSKHQALHLVRSLADTENAEAELDKAIEKSGTSVETPDNTLQTEQLQQRLLQGIDDLPHEQREVFLLHEKNGLSLADIAQVTDSSYESVKSRLRYAIKKLRQHLYPSITDIQKQTVINKTL